MSYWEIQEYSNVKTFENIDELCEYLFDPEYYDSDGVDDALNDEYGYFTIEGVEFSAAEILYNLNEDVYYQASDRLKREQALNDENEFRHQLESMRHGEILNVQGIDVHYYQRKSDNEETVYDSSPEEFKALLQPVSS